MLIIDEVVIATLGGASADSIPLVLREAEPMWQHSTVS
jgi:hypothetical protein